MPASGSEGGARRPDARDLAWAVLISVAAALFYRWTALERFANDGPQLASVFARVPDAVHWQILYLPLARLLARVVTWGDPFEPLRVLSAAGAGVGLGASFLFARGFGLRRDHAFVGVLLVAVARYVWFFAATVEVHALHFGAVGIAACATLFAPWRRPAIALPLAALALGATWTTHGTAVLLGPGWVALVGFARARVAAPFAPRTLLLVVGPVLLAGLLGVMLPLKSWWVARTGGADDLEWGILVAYFHNADHVAFLWEGLLRPLGLVLPCALAGLALTWRAPETARAARALALLCAPGTVFLLAWGVPEDGGYFLGHAPFHAVLAAALAARVPARLAGVGLLVLAQFLVTNRSLRAFDRRFHPRERLMLAGETLGERGYLGKIAYLAPEVTVWLPDVVEVELGARLHAGLAAGLPPEEVAAGVAPTLAAILAERPVAIDVSYQSERFELAGKDYPRYVDAFVEALLGRFDVEERSRGDWTFALLRAPKDG